ncbi:DUF5994 family protein [Streptomyces sp. A3M-1-3]|uniref:DUF5994 family protein n=1 Tax=Streptomyces sp. A3M-1-3 TaxID=2962044 RepID=UPI0020B7A4EC|nr:DUF5994 family protein [Streptomyces sp. A3M-1-3]MCP3816645.1 DUF5994 family protein [Streptomyces sp. A3M-1-3]
MARRTAMTSEAGMQMVAAHHVLPVRLALAGPEGGPRRIDGAWWPRSHDLRDELPSLLAALSARWGRITRVTVDGTQWLAGPRRMAVAGRVVHINRSAAAADRRRICLLSYGVGRCDLVVVPPHTPVDEAARVMAERA